MSTCPSCGRESAKGFAFCPHCGAPLQAERPVAETRKTVTLLFCDVTRSTELGERLDSESVRRVMGRYFDAARACVERHGGTVEKFIGDAVMAVFGIPRVHEDDALRACRAAVEIHTSVAELSKELERERAVEHARRAGHPAEQGLSGEMLAVACTFGPLPVDEALRRLALAQEEYPGRRGQLEGESAILLAMAGRLAESRQALERSRAVCEDLGRPAWAASMLFARGMVELIACDAPEAERALRQGREEFLRIGERSVLSTLSAHLARALCLQHRFEEAEPFIEESREIASSEDVASQVGWRAARAMVLADCGELDEAEGLAREAVELAKSGDALDDQGDHLSVLAGILVAAGRSGEAAALFEEAIAPVRAQGKRGVGCPGPGAARGTRRR